MLYVRKTNTTDEKFKQYFPSSNPKRGTISNLKKGTLKQLKNAIKDNVVALIPDTQLNMDVIRSAIHYNLKKFKKEYTITIEKDIMQGSQTSSS